MHLRLILIGVWLGATLSAWALPADVLVLNLDRNQTDTGPDPNSSTTSIRALLTELGYSHAYQEVSLHDHATLAEIDRRSPDRTKTRTVRAGDRYDLIAAEEYGDAAYWRVLAAANGDERPRLLAPGTVISIPPL